MYETMLFTIETTADHHQVPRVRIKRVPGTIKTETGTDRENGAQFAPGTETSLELSNIRYFFFNIWGNTQN